MPEIKIVAEPRTEFGKGAARRARRAQRVPAVVYGHGTDPRHVTLPEHELMLALKSANVLLELDLSGTKELTLPKSVQRDPIRGSLEHVDLIVVKRGEKVVVEVAIHVTGVLVDGGVLDLLHPTVSIEAEATSIPDEILVDLDRQGPGTQVHASDLVLPAGITLQLDPDTLVANVLAPQAEVEEEPVEGVEGAEGAEGEAAAADAAAEPTESAEG
jgi:large subunit ribosomal protein L25